MDRSLLCGGRVPVVRIGDSQGSSRAVDNGGNQHGLIARQDSLAERALLANLVDHLDGPGSIDTVGLVLKGLLGLATIAVQSTVLESVRDCSISTEERAEGGRVVAAYHGFGFISRVSLPLGHHLARLARNRAVHSILAGLVWAHGEAVVHIAGDEDEIAMVGEGAGGLALLDIGVLDFGMDFGELGDLRVSVSSVGRAVGRRRLGAEQHQGCNRGGKPHRGGGCGTDEALWCPQRARSSAKLRVCDPRVFQQELI